MKPLVSSGDTPEAACPFSLLFLLPDHCWGPVGPREEPNPSSSEIRGVLGYRVGSGEGPGRGPGHSQEVMLSKEARDTLQIPGLQVRPRCNTRRGRKGATSPCCAKIRGSAAPSSCLWQAPCTPKIKVTLGTGWGESRHEFKEFSRPQRRLRGDRRCTFCKQGQLHEHPTCEVLGTLLSERPGLV